VAAGAAEPHEGCSGIVHIAKCSLAAGDLTRAERLIGEALELAGAHGFADLLRSVSTT
jgi:hypothetical protein